MIHQTFNSPVIFSDLTEEEVYKLLTVRGFPAVEEDLAEAVRHVLAETIAKFPNPEDFVTKVLRVGELQD